MKYGKTVVVLLLVLVILFCTSCSVDKPSGEITWIVRQSLQNTRENTFWMSASYGVTPMKFDIMAILVRETADNVMKLLSQNWSSFCNPVP